MGEDRERSIPMAAMHRLSARGALALAGTQNFARGAKQAISEWIDANPAAWKGKDNLSTSAKERVVTLVNWKRTGGAPPTRG